MHWTLASQALHQGWETGYGQQTDEVAAVRVDPGELLVGYHDAVDQQTTRYVKGLSDADLARIVDRSWDPPVSLSVRLVSVIANDLQPAGQAAFIPGFCSAARPMGRASPQRPRPSLSLRPQ
jgi:hypothetical protein